MGAPRQLWKTEIVIWTDIDPRKMEVSRLAREGESGHGYIGKAHSELVAGWRDDPDGPPEDMFYDPSDDNDN